MDTPASRQKDIPIDNKIIRLAKFSNSQIGNALILLLLIVNDGKPECAETKKNVKELLENKTLQVESRENLFGELNEAKGRREEQQKIFVGSVTIFDGILAIFLSIMVNSILMNLGRIPADRNCTWNGPNHQVYEL